jgi:hypothetical protein
MCPSCGSNNQAEFGSEMIVHFSGRENLDKPGVWVFSKLSICLDCGFLRSKIPASELAQIAASAPTSERLVGEQAGEDVLSANHIRREA